MLMIHTEQNSRDPTQRSKKDAIVCSWRNQSCFFKYGSNWLEATGHKELNEAVFNVPSNFHYLNTSFLYFQCFAWSLDNLTVIFQKCSFWKKGKELCFMYSQDISKAVLVSFKKPKVICTVNMNLNNKITHFIRYLINSTFLGNLSRTQNF